MLPAPVVLPVVPDEVEPVVLLVLPEVELVDPADPDPVAPPVVEPLPVVTGPVEPLAESVAVEAVVVEDPDPPAEVPDGSEVVVGPDVAVVPEDASVPVPSVSPVPAAPRSLLQPVPRVNSTPVRSRCDEATGDRSTYSHALASGPRRPTGRGAGVRVPR